MARTGSAATSANRQRSRGTSPPARSARWRSGRTASSASPAPRPPTSCHGWSRSGCRRMSRSRRSLRGSAGARCSSLGALLTGVRHRLDAVRPDRPSAAAARQRRFRARRRRAQPSQRGAHQRRGRRAGRQSSIEWRRRSSSARTKPRRAADDLQQAKDTLAAVIDASPVAIVCSDPRPPHLPLEPRRRADLRLHRRGGASASAPKLMPPRASAESHGLFERALQRRDRPRPASQAACARTARWSMCGPRPRPCTTPTARVRGVARAYEDITDRKRAEEQLKRIAHYDQLTGLPNRLTLQKELGRLLSGDGAQPTAIALFDLDGFKDVNDTLGHSTGDELLIEVGQRLVEVAGRSRRPGLPARRRRVRRDRARMRQSARRRRDRRGHAQAAGRAVHDQRPRPACRRQRRHRHRAQRRQQRRRADRQCRPCALSGEIRRPARLSLLPAGAARAGAGAAQPRSRAAARLSPRTSSSSISSRRSGSRTAPWSAPRRCCAGAIRSPAFWRPAPSSTRWPQSAIAPEVSRWIIHTACAKTAAWRAQGLPLGRIAINLFPTQSARRHAAARPRRSAARAPACRPKRSSSRSPKTSRSTSRTPTGRCKSFTSAASSSRSTISAPAMPR